MKNKQELIEEIEKKTLAKAKKREKKKKPKMNVSGKSVFKLKKLIRGKSWPR